MDAIRVSEGVLSTVAGLGVAVYGVVTVRRGVKTTHWRATSGRITASSMQAGPRVPPGIGKQRSYELRVAYTYEVAGREWHGNRVAFGHEPFGSYGDVQPRMERYVEGTEVTVYYDPADPSQAVLERGAASATWFAIALGIVLLVVGIGLLLNDFAR